MSGGPPLRTVSSRGTAAVVAACATALVVGGCSRSVAVPPPSSLSATDAAACRTLHDALPATLDGQPRRHVEPDSDLTAAWGDPPITLTCGVAPPGALTPTSEAIDIDGVRWFAEELTTGYRFTTLGRVPLVRVTVPDAYAPEVDPLVDLATAVDATLAATKGSAG